MVKKIKKSDIDNVENKLFSDETKSLHAGYISPWSENSVDVPCYPSSTYNFNSPEEGEAAFKEALSGGDLNKFLIYSRVNHANAGILEARLKHAEVLGVEAAVFNSGMSAIITTLLALCPKDKVIACTNTLYGGTHQFLQDFLSKKLGFKVVVLESVTGRACDQLEKIGEQLGVVYIETPANPTLEMFDIEALTKAAKKANPKCCTILDNTFLGIFQTGFKVSAFLDLVLYSATKFLGGHSDMIGGVVICREESRDLMKEIKGLRILLGTILQPYQCSQLITHFNTYRLRMRQQAKNAKFVAEAISASQLGKKKIKKILYPSLLQLETANWFIYKKQCTGGSSIISLWLNTDKAGTFRFLKKIKESGIIQLAVSLGGVESLITHPKTTTHSEIDEKTQEEIMITDNMVRLSIGLEEPDDLIDVIEDALKVV